MGPDFVRHFGRRWQRHLLQQLLDQERAETSHLPSYVIPRDSVQRLRAGIFQVNRAAFLVWALQHATHTHNTVKHNTGSLMAVSHLVVNPSNGTKPGMVC